MPNKELRNHVKNSHRDYIKEKLLRINECYALDEEGLKRESAKLVMFKQHYLETVRQERQSVQDAEDAVADSELKIAEIKVRMLLKEEKREELGRKLLGDIAEKCK